MKQLLQNMKNGDSSLVDVPIPSVKPGFVLVRNKASLVSAGTERMLVEFAEKNLVNKARSRPDLFKQIIQKAQREGIISTLEAAFNRLDQPMSLGYSSAGVVVACGENVTGFVPGDHVACAGGGFAIHAEYVLVPVNLLAKIPEGVSADEACFATLGAIALHGYRLATPQIGERVAVIGLGLLGLLACGIARAAGCQVFGVDTDPARVSFAKSLGYDCAERKSAEGQASEFTHGTGFDVVLICADTKSDDPVEFAAAIARDRAKVVAVGAVGLSLPRKIYYEKEIDFLISRSYGPGRYDPGYEERGIDYPRGYIRWTEGRNLQAVIDLIASGSLNTIALITHRIPIEEASRAYQLITGKINEPFLGVVLTYRTMDQELARKIDLAQTSQSNKRDEDIRLGVLGAGNYANATFLPIVKRVGGARLSTIVSNSGAHAQSAGKKYQFESIASDDQDVLTDQEINAVLILTRHDLHARQSLQALSEGKHVYCEKPAALSIDDVDLIKNALKLNQSPIYTVGYNRRYAPLAVKMHEFINQSAEPKLIQYRINAGTLPITHWLHDPKEGGGRILGECCHFVDFLSFLADSKIKAISITGLPDSQFYREDNVIITVKLDNGSIGTIAYFSNGERSAPKEFVSMSCGGRIAHLNDFRTLETWQNGNHQISRGGWKQDKGHQSSWKAFLQGIRLGKPPIPTDEILGTTSKLIKAVEEYRNRSLPVDD